MVLTLAKRGGAKEGGQKIQGLYRGGVHQWEGMLIHIN